MVCNSTREAQSRTKHHCLHEQVPRQSSCLRAKMYGGTGCGRNLHRLHLRAHRSPSALHPREHLQRLRRSRSYSHSRRPYRAKSYRHRAGLHQVQPRSHPQKRIAVVIHSILHPRKFHRASTSARRLLPSESNSSVFVSTCLTVPCAGNDSAIFIGCAISNASARCCHTKIDRPPDTSIDLRFSWAFVTTLL